MLRAFEHLKGQWQENVVGIQIRSAAGEDSNVIGRRVERGSGQQLYEVR